MVILFYMFLPVFICFWIAFGFIISIRKKVNTIYDFLVYSKLFGKDKDTKDDQ